ncbi:FAD-dependent oxidoreductase [Candidatus Laterigemmans baculatus]|uniref:FAD-dependent oxidoreductase n=1 Tax=Candidatus Laterigemmans baculatus TaxID=2770505 RepID=UPI0013D9B955|nr:FAD-dependent oxidoreductase [Candidatus Laterigemmans baculatus]
MPRPGIVAARRSPVVSRESPGPTEEPFVLYWMHNALRGHENPALDVALCLARQNDLSLLVYQGLCETHRYASDRHHAFILQGARDVQRELSDRGIRFAFHLQRAGARGPNLRTLVRAAAVLVTEESPVEPFLGWLERLRASTRTPILTVDTSCIVPMPRFEQLYTGVAEFREGAEQEFQQRVARSWEDEPVECARYRGRLPFESLDLQDQDLAKLIGACSIDHSVSPVIDMPGGSRAGYHRWRRNGPSSRAGGAVLGDDFSRLHAYLHYGMVSPLRIAREAFREEPARWLVDRLLFREFAHHFCYHVRDAVELFETLPDWSRQTLLRHVSDPRAAERTWEQLARARTEDRFWDACQRSLLKHGELHPEALPRWAQSLLRWTSDPRQALQWALDLNHRFALDGRDPYSYGGLLSSFGQFGQPSDAERPVLGKLAASEPAWSVEDGELSAFEAEVDRPVIPQQPRVAVIGAGMAGLVAARIWADLGIEVTVFERSYRVGGRMATRHADSGASFDHGAQYFTARDARFARMVRAWIQAGVVAPWNGRIVEIEELPSGGPRISELKEDLPRYVGVPDMRSLAEHLAADLHVELETCVEAIEGGTSGGGRAAKSPVSQTLGRWRLSSDDGRNLGEFDYVVACCPPRQAAAVFASQRELAEAISAVEMAPCWAVMVELERTLGLEFDAAFVHHSPLNWIARNNSKPHRGGNETWVLHATAEWSQKHLEEERDEVLVKLLTAFTAATGAHVSNPVSIAAHRWRSALPLPTPARLQTSATLQTLTGLPSPAGHAPGAVRPPAGLQATASSPHLASSSRLAETHEAGCVWDRAVGLGACGDWCGGPRIEGAFLSGAAMAGSLLRYLTIDRHP